MDWVGEACRADGVAERGFTVDVDGRCVPGILWLPDPADGPRPLVLVGHGATAHKRADYVLALGRRLAGAHGFAVAAIDGPGHGERRPPDRTDDVQIFSDFLAEWSRPSTVDDAIADWEVTLDALRRLPDVGDGPLGFWGLSMGTIYGLPFAAAEPRVQVAVFGLMGMVGPTRERMRADAERLSCPVLFLQQWHDALIPREQVWELFDALGSVDKRLHASPGEHSAVPLEEFEFSAAFLARHLAAEPADAPAR